MEDLVMILMQIITIVSIQHQSCDTLAVICQRYDLNCSAPQKWHTKAFLFLLYMKNIK